MAHSTNTLTCPTSLNSWMDFMRICTYDGNITISGFDEVETHLQQRFTQIIQALASDIKQRNDKERLAYRQIVEQQAPHLLGNFDAQFNIRVIVQKGGPTTGIGSVVKPRSKL